MVIKATDVRISDIQSPTQAAAAVMAEVILEEGGVFAKLDGPEQQMYLKAATAAIDAYFVWGGERPAVAAAPESSWADLCALGMRGRAERLAQMLGRSWDYLFEGDLRDSPRLPMRWAVWWALWRWPWPEGSSGPQVAHATQGSHGGIFAAARAIESYQGPAGKQAAGYVDVLARKAGGDALTVDELLRTRWKAKQA